MNGILSDVCLLIEDCHHSTAPTVDSGHPLIRTPDIGKGRVNYEHVYYVTDRVYDERTTRAKPQINDLILAREAPAGNVAILNSDKGVCLGQRTVLIRPNPELVNPQYLCYYMLLPEQQHKLLGSANGSTVSHVNLPVIRGMKIDLPPLPIQRRIADILSAYDDLIENNQRQIKLLEEAAMRLYREWFVFMRFPGHESVRIEDGVPEGWEKIRTSSVMKFNYGKGLLEANRSGDGYPVFGSSGIVGYHDTPLVNENCIVVGRKGNVGSVYLSLMPSYPIDTVFYIIPKINIYYCYFELKSRTFVNNDSAVPGLNRENVEDMPMLLPSDKILEGFHNLIDPYIQRMSYLEQQNVLLQKARDALLPRLMNGGEGLKLEGGAV